MYKKLIIASTLLASALTYGQENESAIEDTIKPPAMPIEILEQILASQGHGLSPEQTRIMRKLIAQDNIAWEAPLVDVDMQNVSKPLAFGPGSVPMNIDLAVSVNTFVMFVDSTGAPWPIDMESVGSQAFTAEKQPAENNADHIAELSVVKPNQSASLTVKLRGVNELATFKLKHNELQKRAYSTITFTVPGISPTNTLGGYTSNASETKKSAPRVRTDDDTLSQLMDDEIAEGATIIPVTSAHENITALFKNGHLYIKAPYEVMSKPKVNMQWSRAGYTVYRAEIASQLLFVDNGDITIADLADDVLYEAEQDYTVTKSMQEGSQ